MLNNSQNIVKLSKGDAMKFLGDWNICVVNAAFDLQSFEFSIPGAAKRLGLSEGEVQRCVDCLEAWGILKRDHSGQYIPPARLVFDDTDFNEGFTQDLFRKTLLKAESKISIEDHQYMTFDVLHNDVIQKYRSDLMNLIEKMSAESRGMPGAEVHVFLASFVRASAPISEDAVIPSTYSAQKFAHDIRSPLSALNAVSSKFHELPDEIRDVLVSATQRINKIADDILEKKKKLETVPTSFLSNSVDLISELRKLIQEVTLVHPQYLFQMKVSADSMTISKEKEEVIRVVSNLINNAVDASREGDTIFISAYESGGTIIIGITDMGSGIPEDILEKIRLNGHSTKNGHGIGVRSAYQFADENKGKLEIRSQVGVGTQVTLSFPNK